MIEILIAVGMLGLLFTAFYLLDRSSSMPR